MKKYLLLLVTMSVFSMPAVGEPPDCQSMRGQTYCNLVQPPEDAYPIESHGYFIFVYPRIITDYFSGCQTAWVETGEKLWITHFKNSKPVSRELFTDDGKRVYFAK